MSWGLITRWEVWQHTGNLRPQPSQLATHFVKKYLIWSLLLLDPVWNFIQKESKHLSYTALNAPSATKMNSLITTAALGFSGKFILRKGSNPSLSIFLPYTHQPTISSCNHTGLGVKSITFSFCERNNERRVSFIHLSWVSFQILGKANTHANKYKASQLEKIIPSWTWRSSNHTFFHL